MADDHVGEVPLERWGLVTNPPRSAGAYVLVERHSGEGRKVPPPDDALQLRSLRPGTDDAHDDNYTVWFRESDLSTWFGGDQGFIVGEWMPPGFDPDSITETD